MKTLAGKSDGKVVIEVTLSTKDIERAYKQIGAGGQKAGKQAGKGLHDNISKGVDGATAKLGGLKAALGKIGSLISVAFIGRELVNFGKKSIELGSNVSEVQNVVTTAFGDMEYKIEEFSKNSIQQFGMSKLAAKKTASTYMAMARGMQMPADAASDMAIALTGLSGDVASFFNISQELADTKLKSVFTGETETLKDLGVVMTQTNLKAFAARQGINKNIEAMSQAELVTLRYKFVTEQLALANGDFAKTQNSWANQTRILSMQWQEFMSIIGQSLIQVLAPALRALNQMVAVMISWAQSFANVTAAIFGKQETQAKASAAAIGGIADASTEAASGQDKLANSTKKAAKEAKSALAPYDQLNVIQNESTGGDSAGAGGASGVSSAVVPPLNNGGEELGVPSWITETKEALAHMWDELAPSFKKAKVKFEKPFEDFKKNILTFWSQTKALKNPLSDWFSGDFITLLKQFVDTSSTVLAGLFDSFNLVFGDILNIVLAPFLSALVTTILPVLTQVGTESLATLKSVFEDVKSIFDMLWTDAVSPALGSIMNIWTELCELIQSKWNEYGKPIFDGIREAFTNTANVLKNAWNTVLKPVWDTFMETIDWLWDKHIKPFITEFLDFVGVLATGALDIYNKFIAPVVDWVVRIFGPSFSRTFQLVIDILGSVIGTAIDVARGIIEALKGVINFIVGVFTGDWKRAWDGIKQVFKGVWDAFGGIVKGVVNVVIDLINSLIRSVVSGLNTVIRTANKIKFTPPDWVPGIGGKTFGFHIQEVQAKLIPKLAQGAVIPPNREFMAVLGDQKNGRNLEAPEDLIRKIVREESGSRDSGGDWHIYIMMPDGTIKAETIISAAQRANQRAGKTIIAVEE